MADKGAGEQGACQAGGIFDQIPWFNWASKERGRGRGEPSSSPPKQPGKPPDGCGSRDELHGGEVTCPGVVLMNKEDVYLSVCILGKYLKTKCLPPVFPMVFRERMIFHKVFGEAVDPGHVAELLELDTATFELIQLIPPVGETLAVLAENTREFLYPGPRLSPSYVGSNRDLLMKRAISFPGIAPKLEFSTFSAIEECSLQEGDAMMMRVIRKPQETDSPNTSFDTFDEHISKSASRLMQSGRLASVHSAPSSVQKHPPSPLLHRSSLKERFEKVSSNTTSSDWEEIHDRVKNILKTHRSSRGLHFVSSDIRHLMCHLMACSGVWCHVSYLRLAFLFSSRLFDDTMVHLGSGHFWSNQAARYKGVPHRAVFEESLEKIYGNLYKKASGST
ncbi:SPAT6 protein, partial [Polypterus senegalus]